MIAVDVRPDSIGDHTCLLEYFRRLILEMTTGVDEQMAGWREWILSGQAATADKQINVAILVEVARSGYAATFAYVG